MSKYLPTSLPSIHEESGFDICIDSADSAANLSSLSRFFSLANLIQNNNSLLVNAERRSKWEEQGATSDDVDTLWLIHIVLGSTIAVGCSLGLLALFQFDYCSTVVAKEIFSDDDRHVVRGGRAKKKFLF